MINLWTMNNTDIVDVLRKEILQDIPTGVQSPTDLARVEYLLGKLANDYVYLISMLNYSRNFVRQLKRKGPEYKDTYEDMIDKRDSIEAIASAVKLQYQAVSRMLTIKVEIHDELEMYDYRKEKIDENNSNQ